VKREVKVSPHTEKLPLLFGANFHDDPLMKKDLRKSHNTKTGADGALVPAEYAPHTGYDFTNGMTRRNDYGGSSTATLTANGSARLGGAHGGLGGTYPDGIPTPKMLETIERRKKQQKQDPELHFMGYFTESVFESKDESVRVRKLAVTYFTEDDTISIREFRQPNSGIDQSQFLSRQKVPKDGGDGSKLGLITVDDMYLGSVLPVYGRHITLTSCDAASRAYIHDTLGMEVGEDREWPTGDDHFGRVQASKKLNPKREIPIAEMENKRALESLYSGGQISKRHPEDVRCAKQFYSTRINEHLSFAAIWDDRGKISGDLHHVAIRYYLENDTVEVIERPRENCGKDGGPKLLVRQRIPKKGVDVSRARFQQNTFGVTLKNDFMVAEDFAIGDTINLHSRNFYVYDADEFTRKYFIETIGRPLADPIDISAVESSGQKRPPVFVAPPHNGFGSEEDSLQNCRGLELKAPRVDAEKQWRERGKTMIFSARLVTSDPTDIKREFVITFHRATDEVEIGERSLRNSGIIGGKFLQKGRHLRELPGGRKIPYTPADFDEGKEITIMGRVFKLLSMDTRCRKIVAGIEDPICEERVKELVIMFRTLVTTKYLRVHDAFRAMAPSGKITVQDVMDSFKRSSCRVNPEEAAHVVQYIVESSSRVRGTNAEERDTECINYDEFLAFIEGAGADVMDAASNSTKSIKNVNMTLRSPNATLTSTNGNNGTTTSAAANTSSAATEFKKRNLKKALIDKISERRGTVQEVFRMMAGFGFNSLLSRQEFEKGLVHILHFNVSSEDRELVMGLVFDGRENMDGEITFKQFHEFVESD